MVDGAGGGQRAPTPAQRGSRWWGQNFGDMDTDPFVQEVERIDAAAGTLGRLGHLHVTE